VDSYDIDFSNPKRSKKEMKKFNDEFKANAVRLVREERLKVGDVACDLGIGVSTLKLWLGKHKQGRLLKTDKRSIEDEEIKRLRKENRVLRQEREILKKAMGIFSSMSKANTEL